MASIKSEVTGKVGDVRRRAPIVDHLIKMQAHFGKVQASQQAGAVTYFAFLSLFPILALAFFVVGYVAKIYPQAQDNLVTGISNILPNLITTDVNDPNAITLDDMQSAAAGAGIIGAVVLLYSGLSWLSALRQALITVFETPRKEQPGFVIGKVRDLATMGVIGFVLVLSVAISGVVTALSSDILDLVGLKSLSPALYALAIVLGLAANALLFFSMFKLLTDTETPRRSLWQGAALGAVGFEILTLLSKTVIKSTASQPAFQAFGIALTLIVFINYFTRLVMYAAAFACTSPQAIAARESVASDPVQGPRSPSMETLTTSSRRPAWVGPFAAGGAAMLGLMAFIRSRVHA